MEVRPRFNRFLMVVCLLGSGLIAGCGAEDNGKDPNQVFPDDPPTKLNCSGQKVEGRFIVQWEDGRFSVHEGENREQFIREFVKPNLRNIRLVEHDQIIEAKLGGTVNTSAVIDANWGPTMVNAAAAWNQNIAGQKIIVAVVDTGVDITNTQLKSRIHINQIEANGQTGVDDDHNGYVDDITGFNFVTHAGLTGDNQYHGTHVAGIIAADHSGQVLGMAPQAEIMPLAFLNNKGQGLNSDAIAAMQYAKDNGAQVVNASWGGSPCSQQLQDMIVQLQNKGVFFIAAAGNSGVNLNVSPEYPAAYGEMGYLNMLTVGASTYQDFLASFSNYSTRSVHLVAPGDTINSTLPKTTSVSGMGVLSGTSMATPFVSGAVALMLSHPSMINLSSDAKMQRARNALLNSTKAGNFNAMNGRLDIGAAVSYLNSH